MGFKISEAGSSLLRQRLSDAVRIPTKDIPGAVVCIVNSKGELIFAQAKGQKGANTTEDISLDTIFWLASCSKLILSIACMQLIEKGLLDLDNPDQVEFLCPELKDVKVLEQNSIGEEIYVPKTNRITLRMLLAHTAGFNYPAYHGNLRDWIMSRSKNPLDFDQPLIAQPGEDWNYGFNNEWVGLMIEKVSGKRMDDYLRDHIFDPLGLNDTGLFLTSSMRERLAKMNHRSPLGILEEGEHFMRANLDIKTPEEKEKVFQNAAGGCFSKPSEYCEIISVLLNGGTSPTTGAEILKSSTVDLMFENQIPQHPNFARKGITAAIPEETYPIPEIYPTQPHHQPQGWGLSFMLTLEPTSQGRGHNTGSWAGMANCYWWADREKGVGGFIGTQIVPFADPTVLALCSDVETLVYSNQVD